VKNLFYNNARKLDFKSKSEDRFMSEKVIWIDGVGWGDLILGVARAISGTVKTLMH
jgi:hypothetical protein